MTSPSRRWRRLGLVVGAALAAGFLLTRGPVLDVLATVAARFMVHRGQRAALGPLIEEAQRLGLDYQTILRDPMGHVGQPVVWCVDHPSWGNAYLAGKPSEPLVLENESAFPINSPTSGGTCTTVVATIGEVPAMFVPERGVVLHFVGLP
ncbi:MAG: hypothetical protein HZB91_05595 [Elusimicrobia bacterium]|nr:hypothetical protein [Elusimicrobiota bacterium]